jgi:hypothetical protein
VLHETPHANPRPRRCLATQPVLPGPADAVTSANLSACIFTFDSKKAILASQRRQIVRASQPTGSVWLLWLHGWVNGIMSRSKYFEFIVDKLTLLGYRIEVLGGLNLLNEHVLSEDFYQHLLNLLFDWKLVNLNAVQRNAPGIDLVDEKNRYTAPREESG